MFGKKSGPEIRTLAVKNAGRLVRTRWLVINDVVFVVWRIFEFFGDWDEIGFLNYAYIKYEDVCTVDVVSGEIVEMVCDGVRFATDRYCIPQRPPCHPGRMQYLLVIRYAGESRCSREVGRPA